MTTLTEDPSTAIFQVRGYKPGWLKINDEIFTQSVLLGPDFLISDWHPQNFLALKVVDFIQIAEIKPAIFLLGTGSRFEIVSLSLYGELINQGIGVEIMDTSAACRTFNALAAEGRHVIAGLIIK